MTLEEIREHTERAKGAYQEWLATLTEQQGAVLLAFVKDAYDKENGRGETLDAKGNLVLTTALAALAALAAVAKVLVADLAGRPLSLMSLGLVVVAVALLVPAMLAASGTRIRQAWCGPNPEVVFREDIREVLAAGTPFVQLDLILHYVDNYLTINRLSNAKADRLQHAQETLIFAFALVAAVGIGRAYFLGQP